LNTKTPTLHSICFGDRAGMTKARCYLLNSRNIKNISRRRDSVSIYFSIS
jgi:hypothetical protein